MDTEVDVLVMILKPAIDVALEEFSVDAVAYALIETCLKIGEKEDNWKEYLEEAMYECIEHYGSKGSNNRPKLRVVK